MKNEQQDNELNGLVGKIKDHLAGSETLAGLKFSKLTLTANDEGTHRCCADDGSDQIELPDSVPCPVNYHDC